MTRMTDVVLPPTFEQTASFTPGPWTIGVSADHTPAICVPCEQSSGFVVAHINRIPLMRGVDGSMEANARLIAAAPELLAALEFLIETKWKSNDRDNMEFVGRVTCYQLEQARAAIAAAKAGAL